VAEPDIVITDAPDPAWAKLLGDGLNAFNDEAVGYTDRLPLAVMARDPNGGEVGGGIIGRTSLGVLFIDLVYLPKSMRGSGVGSRLLAAAENEGRRRGCSAGVLYTISFQAPEFYKRHGWRVFGEVPCQPPGTSRVFLTKTL
jgi:GNAT superfamily N-acetyltransferase